MSHARRAVAVSAMAALLGVGLAGCGGDEKPDTKGPSSASPSTASTSATPTPSSSPTPTAAPLSRFEDQPAVKAFRAWAVAYGRDINRRDQQHSRIKAVSTGQAVTDSGVYEGTDLKNDVLYPGPVPFTPTSVKTVGGTVQVNMCMQFKGFTLDRKTRQPSDSTREISGARATMKQVGGQWRLSVFNSLTTAQQNCSGVTVKGVPWS